MYRRALRKIMQKTPSVVCVLFPGSICSTEQEARELDPQGILGSESLAPSTSFTIGGCCFHRTCSVRLWVPQPPPCSWGRPRDTHSRARQGKPGVLSSLEGVHFKPHFHCEWPPAQRQGPGAAQGACGGRDHPSVLQAFGSQELGHHSPVSILGAGGWLWLKGLTVNAAWPPDTAGVLSQVLGSSVPSPDHTVNSSPTSGLEPGPHFVQIFGVILKCPPARGPAPAGFRQTEVTHASPLA